MTWMYKKGGKDLIDSYFNFSWGFSHHMYAFNFAMEKLDQIEPPLTKDERMRAY